MEYANSVWQIGIIALVAGGLIGALAYRLLATSVKQAERVKSELEETQAELEGYKESVNQHFDQTSALFNDLTQNYVKVYQHLAKGAQSLGDGKTFNNLLEQHQAKVGIAAENPGDVADQSESDSPMDTPLAQQAPVDFAVEASEPVSDASGDEAVAASPVKDGENSETPELNDEPRTETLEPVLNVDALEEVADKTDTDLLAESSSAISEDKKGVEVSTTRH